MTKSFQQSNLSKRMTLVGQFYCSTGMFEVCDPMVNDVTCASMPVNVANQTVVYMRNCPPGRYEVFYEFDALGEPVNVFITHESVNIFELPELLSYFSPSGDVVTSLGGCICLIESLYRDDASVCFYEIEEQASYEPVALIEQVLYDAPYSYEAMDRLLRYLNKCIFKGCYASGYELSDVLKDESAYWNGFRSLRVKSSHWAVDVCSRVKCGYLPFSVIRGGVVFRAMQDSCPVFTMRNPSQLAVGVRIGLKMTDDAAVSTSLSAPSNIIPFQEN